LCSSLVPSNGASSPELFGTGGNCKWSPHMAKKEILPKSCAGSA
jgi:hypothetical protein